jgi:uncharacterized protein with LGFP repeats
MVRSFYAYHVKSLGWSDIGYNFLVDRFGNVYEGRAGGVTRPVLGAHAGGFNSNTVGVAIIGNFQTENPTAASLHGLQRVLAWKLRMHGVNPQGTVTLRSAGGSSSRYRAGTNVTVRTIAAHRDTNSTACPGNRGYQYMTQIRNGTAAFMGGASAAAVPQTAIEQAHARLGGNFGLLGTAETEELRTADGVGRYVRYRNGVIYWHPSTGAREVHGDILRNWTRLGNERSKLGYPTTDELSTARNTGRYSRFQHGSIYWSPRTGAHEVRGNIFGKWASLDWERGFLGFPLTSELRAPDGRGRFNHFQGGSIYWTPQHGAHEVHGSIRERWKRERWERGRLGYPISDEFTVNGGRASDFEGGRITWNRRTGATTVTLR